MAGKKRWEGHLRYFLIVVFAALAGAAAYLWLERAPAEAQLFAHVYQVSLRQASGNMRLMAVLGMPLRASVAAAKYHFSHSGARARVRYEFPLSGPRGRVLIKGEAIALGKNWLIVELTAYFPNGAEMDLTPNVSI